MQLKTYTTLILALVISSLTLSGQTFYSEDFSGGGVPSGWTNEDLTSMAGEEVIFVHTTDPDEVNALGNADTETFMASSTMNGYLYADSDRGLAAAPATNHTTQLTTDNIDCTGQTNVFLQFETLIGVFEQDAVTAALVRVSNDDGANWTDFTVFPNLTTAVRWSDNPQFASIDISSIAANQAAVKIQFQWIGGWEYFWAIDDLALTSEDPRPANDMRINEFAAVAPNAMTPMSQVDPFGFIADIENVGSAGQTDIDLVMTIVDGGGTTAYTNTLNYDMIASDSLAENKFFDGEFTPPAQAADYVGTYSLDYMSDEPDGFPDNNELAFSFAVTDNLFAKELGATGSVRPADNVDFTYGNVFYVNSATDASGNQLYADEISFSVSTNTAATVQGKTVNVFLYSWDGTLDPNGVDITEDLYSFAGISEYTFIGDEGTAMISVPVNEGDPVALEANTYYMPAIQYISGDGTTEFFIATSGEFDYAAMNFYSDSMAVVNNDPQRARYAGILDVGNEGTLGTVGFGFDIVPVVRLSISVATATEEVQLPSGSVAIFPNPAKEYAQVDLNLEEVTSGTLQILDMQGKVIQTHALNSIQQHRLELVTKNLPSGQYSVRVQTELGVSTQKLIVQH